MEHNELKYNEARDKFITTWGNMASNWGISKTMGTIHAYLLVSDKPKNIDEMTLDLDICKSNATQNVKSLVDWGIVYKQNEAGERKEYFYAEKNIWKVLLRIIQIRKEKELNPILSLLSEMTQLQPTCKHSEEFCNTIKELEYFSKKVDGALENITKCEGSFLMQNFLKMVR